MLPIKETTMIYEKKNLLNKLYFVFLWAIIKRNMVDRKIIVWLCRISYFVDKHFQDKKLYMKKGILAEFT